MIFRTIKYHFLLILLTGFFLRGFAQDEPYDGLKVEGRYLIDQCGEKVILRGVNAFIIYWDWTGEVHYPNIRKSGANCVRIFWATGASAQPYKLDETIQNCIDHNMIPMVCLWDATGKPFGGEKWKGILDYWTKPKVVNVLKKHEKFLLLNIANEVGKNEVTNEEYRSAYKHAIDTLRSVGLRMPLVIDASNWGRAERYIIDNADFLMDSDPLGNVFFSWHPWDNSTSPDRVDTFFEKAKNEEIPIIVGEFSNEDVFGKPFKDPDIWRHIIKRCHEYENGYLAWWWASKKDSAMHEITKDRIYGNWANDPWGKAVTESSEYSIKKTSVRPRPMLEKPCEE